MPFTSSPYTALGSPGVCPARPDGASNMKPVEPEEIAFALTIFVAAATRRLVSDESQLVHLSAASLEECRGLFASLSMLEPVPAAQVAGSIDRGATSLEVAFLSLWQQYEGSLLRHSVCARVLGFYFLMERTAGSGIGRFTEQCPEQPETVMLKAEVVRAIAGIELNSFGQLSETLLYEVIEDMKLHSFESEVAERLCST